MATRDEAIQRVMWATEDGAHIALTIWCVDDLMGHSQIPFDEANVMIDDIDKNQDAETGITWATLQWYLREGRYKWFDNTPEECNHDEYEEGPSGKRCADCGLDWETGSLLP